MPTLVASPELRTTLLEYFLEVATSQDLSDWLRVLNIDPKGTVVEKRQRIRQNTKYLGMPAETFPEQTESYLQGLSSDDLADICERLGLPAEGNRKQRYRRIMRAVRLREGWLGPSGSDGEWSVDRVKPFIETYPLLGRGQYERDYYYEFQDEMTEVFGLANVHPQHPVAHGTTLKIDFHIGPPSDTGVGVEWKVPGSNSDLQKAMGQLGQYQARYGSNLIIVLVPDWITESGRQLFRSHAAAVGVVVVER